MSVVRIDTGLLTKKRHVFVCKPEKKRIQSGATIGLHLRLQALKTKLRSPVPSPKLDFPKYKYVETGGSLSLDGLDRDMQ